MNVVVLNKILELLRANGMSSAADDLENLASKYNTSSVEDKKVIATEIKNMCHPKWLGDLYIKGISIQEWYGMLNKLVSIRKPMF